MLCFDVPIGLRSSGGRVVKLLACGARGPGSTPGLATWIFRDWLSPASKSRYGWKIAKSTLILKTTNQPIRLDFINYTSLISCEARFHDKTLIYMHKIPIDIYLVCFKDRPPNVCDHLFSNIVIRILLPTKLYTSIIFYRPCLYVIWLIMEISHGAGSIWRRKPFPG